MEHEGLLNRSRRVIELGAPDQRLATLLEARGITRYVGLVDPGRLSEIRCTGPQPDRFQPLTDPATVEHCSTDLLIIRSGQARAMWGLHGEIGARFVALEHDNSVMATEGRFSGLLAVLARRSRRCGILELGGATFTVHEVCRPRGPQPRLYFSPVWGAAGLAARLADANLDHVVLRWFEDLPRIAPGEDLDVLVSDDDLDAFRDLVESEPGTQPLDLYSVSGLPHSDFREAAYYPPPLALQLLRSAVVHRSGFRVPAPAEHLRSLAYHAVYHKGPASGLPLPDGSRTTAAPEHDYRRHLTALAAAEGVTLEPTMDGVDRYLRSVGWRPPADTLRRLSGGNPWVAGLLGDDEEEGDTLPGRAQLAVFLVRGRTPDVVGHEEFRALLDRFGFDILLHETLDDEDSLRVSHQLRGGNWGRGPFPRSGGPPVAFAVAIHHAPVAPYPSLELKYPHLTNAETYELKEELRGLVRARVPPDDLFNPIHSSDNTGEAWEYLAVIAPEQVPGLRRLARDRAMALTPPQNLVRELNLGRRARVDVVTGPGGPLVRKTFAPSFRRFLEREIAGRQDLSDVTPAVPHLGRYGEHWLETPLYRSIPPPAPGRLLPLPLLRDMVAVLRRIHAAGYDIVDAKPGNFVLDDAGGLKLVDLEFLHRYAGPPPAFPVSVNFVGPWAGFDGDVPVGDMSYESRWLGHTGMPAEVLADGTVAEQRFHRALWMLRSLTVLPGAPPRRVLRGVREFARHQKWLARRRLAGWSRSRSTVLTSAPVVSDQS